MDSNPQFKQDPTFRDLVNLIRRGLAFALALGIAAALATYVLTKREAPTYQASATVLASQPDSALQQFGVSLVTAPQVGVSAYQAAATSTPVVSQALKSLGNQNPSERQVEELLARVSVTADSSQNSSLLHLDVKNANPKAAADTANALATALLAWDKQRATQNLQKIANALQGQISSLTAQIAQATAGNTADRGQISGLENLRAQQELQLNSARALENSAVGNLEVLEPAVVPIKPVAPRPKSDAALGFVLAILLAYGLLLLRDALDTRFRGTEDIAHANGAPILAEFPRLHSSNRHLPREAVNYLRANVLFATAHDHPKVLLVTSTGAAEGKTSVALNLAESFARNDYRTLLIDADLRKPAIGAEYSLLPHQDIPLHRLLADPTMTYEPNSVKVDGHELHVIPSFDAASSPTELLSQGFSKLVARFSPDYDAIVVDSSPVLPVADALTIAPHCTGVIFCISLPSSDRRNVAAALGLLNRIGVKALGLVVTNLETARGRRPEYGYTYGYGYGYGPQESSSAGTPREAGAGDVRQEPGRIRGSTAPLEKPQGSHD